MTFRHRPAAFALAALTILGASACSSDDDTSSADSPSDSQPEAAPVDSTPTEAPETVTSEATTSAFPVTLSNRLGEVTIEAQPERIVALGANDIDAVYAMGLTPVGVTTNASTGGLAPWLEDTYDLDGVELIDISAGTPFEQIAALEPDVILASPLPTIDADYELLSDIAPVVADTNGVLTDTWQERTTKIGEALGMPDAAADVIADGEAALATVAEEYPELDGQTYTLAWARAADQIAVMAADDVTSQMFGELGLTIPESVLDLSANTSGGAGTGAATLTLETIGELDADLMIVAYGDPALQETVESSPVFQAVPAVAEGRYQAIDIATVSAFRVPSALSIEWMFAQLADGFEAATS